MWVLLMLQIAFGQATAEAEDVPPAEVSELRQYLAETGESHPLLKQLYAEWQAALERVPQARALDDPMFMYGQFVQADVARARFALSQKFPWFGTRDLRANAAAHRAEAALQRFFAARDQVFAEVKMRYAQYAYLAEAIEVAESQGEILRYMEDTEASRFSLGLAAQHDILRVQIEAANVQRQLDELRLQRSAASSALSAAIGRQTDPELPWPSELGESPALPPAPIVIARVRSANPQLFAFDAALESAENEIALARKKGYPEITAGIDYTSISMPRKIRPDRPYPASLHGARRLGQILAGGPAMGLESLIDIYAVGTIDEPMSYRSGGDDDIMISLSMNIPIWRKKIRAGVAEARYEQEALEFDRERTALELETEARDAYFLAENAAARYTHFAETVVPMAQQTYESIQSSYAADSLDTSLLDLLNAANTLLDFQLEALMAQRDLHMATARLEQLMGGAAE